MMEYVDPGPVDTCAAPVPVIEHIAPAPAVTSDAHGQQLPPSYTSATDIADDTFDITDLVHTQFFHYFCGDRGTYFASCRWSSSSLERIPEPVYACSAWSQSSTRLSKNLAFLNRETVGHKVLNTVASLIVMNDVTALKLMRSCGTHKRTLNTTSTCLLLQWPFHEPEL